MSENPYQSPQALAERGVVIRRWFPLKITGDRVVEVALDAGDLDRRIHAAAKKCGYTVAAIQENRWTLRRGGPWQSLFSFNVRKISTRTVIETEFGGRVRIRLRCWSFLHFATPGDATRIAGDLDELEMELVYG